MSTIALGLLMWGAVTLAYAAGIRSTGAVEMSHAWLALRGALWTLAVLLGMTIAEPILRVLGVPSPLNVLGSGSLMLAGVYVGGATTGADRARSVWRRGAAIDERVVLPARQLRWLPKWVARWSRTSHSGSAPLGLAIGGLPIPEGDEAKHFKFIGTTGTGKSTAIHALLRAALTRGDRAVVADPDGGYLNRHYDERRGDLILNPFDARSVVWQPFDEIEATHDARELARALVGTASGEAAAWHGYAETFLAAVLERLKCLPEAQSRELYRVISTAPMTELRALLSGTSAAPLVESGNERMFGSVRSIAMSRLAALPAIVRQSVVHASVRQWIREGRGVLFMPYQADQIATLRHLLSAWLRLAIFETMARGESEQRLWFVIDELDALGAIDGLKDALARLRKFGGRCVLGFQSIAQVSGTYGDAEARTIVENCATTLILRCSASDGGGTARFASQLIGQREVERDQETRARNERDGRVRRSHTRQIALEAAVLASEIEALADLEGYLKRASDSVWRKVGLRGHA